MGKDALSVIPHNLHRLILFTTDATKKVSSFGFGKRHGIPHLNPRHTVPRVTTRGEHG
jgi:hypothetical protein